MMMAGEPRLGTAHLRPFVDDPIDTSDLPATPPRDHRIPASAWRQAPDELLHLGDELGEPVEYKRRIGQWLLWRAGPAVGRSTYLAVSPDLTATHRFELYGKQGQGVGPDGLRHERFRTWKESLRDHAPASGGEAP